MAISVVFFDVGETLIDESRLWDRWAAYLGVTGTEFHAALAEVIARGGHHRDVFERFRPGFDLVDARRHRAAAGDPDDARDLYPDAAPCLQTLRQSGYRIGVAGNQPPEAEAILQTIGLDLDFVATSSVWQVEKPSPVFFAKVAELAAVAPSSIAYVGDRLDTDILPARDAGMMAVFIARGPWGRAHTTRPEIARANVVITTLMELPAALGCSPAIR